MYQTFTDSCEVKKLWHGESSFKDLYFPATPMILIYLTHTLRSLDVQPITLLVRARPIYPRFPALRTFQLDR